MCMYVIFIDVDHCCVANSAKAPLHAYQCIITTCHVSSPMGSHPEAPFKGNLSPNEGHQNAYLT